MTADRLVEEAARVALLDIRELFDANGHLRRVCDLPEDVARAIASVEVTKARTRKADKVTVEEWGE